MADHLYQGEFKWPEDKPQKNANNIYTRKLALLLCNGNPNLWKHYIIYNLNGNPESRVKPGWYYKIFWINPDKVKFVWPETEDSLRATEKNAIVKALEITGFAYLDPGMYFITDIPNGKTPGQHRFELIVVPGKTYYLRPIVNNY
jgi:hypothetical protein